LILFPLTTDPAVLLLLHVRTVWDTKDRNPTSISPTGDALNAKPAAISFSLQKKKLFLSFV